MPNSQNLYNEIVGLKDKLGAYTPIDPNEVYKDLMSRVDFMKPQYQDLRRTEAQAYAAPATVLDDYYKAYGNDPSQGPSASSRLSSMLGQVGRLYGTANTMGDLINAQGGRIQDLANTTASQYDLGRQSILDRLNIVNPLYQSALQQEEADKQRAIQAKATNDQANYYKQLIAAANKSSEAPGKLDGISSTNNATGQTWVTGKNPDGSPKYEWKPFKMGANYNGKIVVGIRPDGTPILQGEESLKPQNANALATFASPFADTFKYITGQSSSLKRAGGGLLGDINSLFSKVGNLSRGF
jgi:hypothetical protein